MHATEHPRPDPDGWRDHAACRDMDTDDFYPERGNRAEAIQAICRTCPVQATCLADALEWERSIGLYAVHGIRGGLTAPQRRRIISGGRPDGYRKPIPHGTEAGYHAHRRRKQSPCDGCREAHSAANYARRENTA